MFKNLMLAALALGLAMSAHAAPEDLDDTLRIYGPPRNRVHTLSARVARQKVAMPIIAFHPDESVYQEATAEDLQRRLNRQIVPPLHAVGQTPTAAPGIPPEYSSRDIVVQ